jgi:hypothetical protein
VRVSLLVDTPQRIARQLRSFAKLTFWVEVSNGPVKSFLVLVTHKPGGISGGAGGRFRLSVRQEQYDFDPGVRELGVKGTRQNSIFSREGSGVQRRRLNLVVL